MTEETKPQLIKVLDYYKKNGLLKFIRRVCNRFGLEYLNRNLIFFHFDLNNITNDFKKPYTFHPATIEDVKRAQNYYERWFTKNEAIQRLKNGHRLFVLFSENEMVFMRWIDFKKVVINYFDLHFDIPDNFAYVTGVYTAPEFRRKNIGFKMANEINHYLKNNRINHTFSVVDPENTAALKLNKKLGGKEYQFVNYKRYAFIRYYCVKKYNSSQHKIFINILRKRDNDIWKCFLD